jgi:20S proteasome subunit alpha 7
VRSIHTIHDDVKDKEFVLEMSWVCEATNGKHEFIPADVVAEAEAQAKKEIEDDSDDEMDE